MNKLSILALSAAVSTVLIAGPLAAQQRAAASPIVVSPPDRAPMVLQIEQDLSDQLRSIRYDPRRSVNGATSIRFVAGRDGRPSKVVTYRSSGSSYLDRKTRDAVWNLSSLRDLAASAGDNRVVQANIVVADSDGQAKRLMAAMNKAEERRIAASHREREVLALNLASRTDS
jgi:hypothetical protein